MGEPGTIDGKRLLIRPRPFMYGVWGQGYRGRLGADLNCHPDSERGNQHNEAQSQKGSRVGCPTDQENGDAREIGDDRPFPPHSERPGSHQHIVA